MSDIQTAWDGLAAAIEDFAHGYRDLGDIVQIGTTQNQERISELSELRALAEDAGQLHRGLPLTFTRIQTGETLCVAVGLTEVAPAQNQPGLLSWQFGIWSGSSGDWTMLSGVLALQPDSADLVVLDQLQETARPVLAKFVEECHMTNQAFISYVREDSGQVDVLRAELKKRGVATWTDREDLAPGTHWKDEIRKAIQSGAAFIACFSASYHAKPKTYMNEELVIAIEELRMRPRDRAWFFPVILDDSHVPSNLIGAGETLGDLQSVSLAGADHDDRVRRLASAVRQAGRGGNAIPFTAPPTA